MASDLPQTQAYGEVLRALYGRTANGIKLGIERTRQLLRVLGDPQKRMGHIVVAGTNGKGSTSSLIAEALRVAGHRVGLFTSPHLLRFTERARIDGEELERDWVVQLYHEITAAEKACKDPPSFFELTTAMALLAFARAKVDVAVLEVGLGGRLDATNVVDKELAVITPIALDHQRFLGASLEAIAGEKAGILSPHGRLVLAPQPPEAERAILERARSLQADVIRAPSWRFVLDTLQLSGAGLAETVSFSSWPPGGYQAENVATAVATCLTLDRHGVACPLEAIQEAAGTARWPGRYHWVGDGPPALLDGAHNPAGFAALLASLERDPRAKDKPLHAVVSILDNRPAQDMLNMLRPRHTSLHLCPVRSHRTRSQEALRGLAPDASVYENFEAAWSKAQSRARADGGFVLVAGSLFLVGEALTLLTGEAADPPVDG